MKTKFYVKVIILAILLTAMENIINPILGMPVNLNDFIWSLLPNLLITYIAALYVSHAMINSWAKLFLASLTILFMIGSSNILIEAYIFKVTTLAQTITFVFQSLFWFAVLAVGLTYFFKTQIDDTAKEEYDDRSVIGWVWRIGLTTFLYMIIYLTAGLILQASLPALDEFYKDKIPSLDLIFNAQILRGLIFSLVGLLFIRTSSLRKYEGAVLLGLIFSVLGGIAPLMHPNEFMPLEIRIGHGFEVGISNFVYGFLVGVILNQNVMKEKGCRPNADSLAVDK
jgi:hypothetical protein